jgi:hypothetical protein
MTEVLMDFEDADFLRAPLQEPRVDAQGAGRVRDLIGGQIHQAAFKFYVVIPRLRRSRHRSAVIE